jgi:ribosomal protein S18 acetylase RimI-like enzyme
MRIAKRDDAERIVAVINAAFREAEDFFVDGDRVDLASILKLLDSGEFLLAESASLLLGCVYVEPRPGDVALHGMQDSQSAIRNPKFSRAYLGLLAVDPVQQQHGIGSALMDAAEEYCRELGAGFIDLIVVSLREDLVGYYRRRGYVVTGTSPFPPEIETKLACHFVEMSKSLRQEKEVSRSYS